MWVLKDGYSVPSIANAERRMFSDIYLYAECLRLAENVIVECIGLQYARGDRGGPYRPTYMSLIT